MRHHFRLIENDVGAPLIVARPAPQDPMIGFYCSGCGSVRWQIPGHDLPALDAPCQPKVQYWIQDAHEEDDDEGPDDPGDGEMVPVNVHHDTLRAFPGLRKAS